MGFSAGGLGMGVSFQLKDEFSKTADVIKARMGELEDNTEDLARGVASAMNQIKVGFATAAVGGAILAPFFSGLQAASDLEENINKTKVAFGESSQEVLNFADTTLDAFGITGGDALQMASLFGDMATSLGVTESSAAKMSKRLVGLAGDLSSFKNISAERAQSALRGVFTGETRSLKDLGIVINENTLKQTAASLGISKTMKNMSGSEKVMLRYQAVLNATTKAQGDFSRTSEGYANSKRVFEGALGDVSEALGGVILPIVAKVIQSLSFLFKATTRFINSPLGGWIFKIVAGLGLLLTVLGLVMIVSGGARFAIFKLAGAFGEATKAKIIDILITQGVTAGLRSMAVAAWSAIAPFAAMALVVVAVVVVLKVAFDLFKAGFTAFDNFKNGDTVTGIAGFFTKLAGVIRGVAAIWQSWNGSTFALTEAMAQKLESLGILEFVVSLGTWAIRVKEFFSGVFAGLSQGFTFMADIISSIWSLISSVFSPIGDFFDSLGFSIGKNTSAIEKWKTAGKVAGFILIGIFTALAISAGIAAVSMIIAFLPAILVLGAITLGIIAIIWVVKKLGEVFPIIGDTIVGVWDSVTQAVFGFFNFMFSMPFLMFDAGVAIVQNLWNGIKAIWHKLVDWMSEKLKALIAPITGLFGDGEVVGGETVGAVAPPLSAENTHHAMTSKNPNISGGNTTNTVNNNAAPITTQFLIDSDLVAEKVIEQQELKDSRQ